MKKNLLILVTLLFISKLGTAQLLDKYGLNIGSSYSNQFWHDNLNNYDPYTAFKSGLCIFLSGEKNIIKVFSIRTELGYIQKGFKNKDSLTSYNPITGVTTSANVVNKNVILHNLALNIELKIKPFKSNWLPYSLIGFRNDYTIAYKDIIVKNFSGINEIDMYTYKLKKFNKYNIGALIGLGFDIHDQFYFEFEFNPAFTKSNNERFTANDITYDFKLGINLNKLLKKQ